jgi:hypothetical protein
VAGLSARNERTTVRRVAETVSRGLSEAFPDRDRILVLADSCSTDDTVAAFNRAAVDVATCVRTADGEHVGKGHAVRLILEEAVARRAAAVVCIDADLQSLRPDWVACLARPIFGGVDLVTPVYLRSARDSAVTHHFAHPFVAAIAGLNIRQPTGGEFALSGALAEHVLSREWPAGAYRYGIDMFATLTAAARGARIASARLGTKVHRANPAKLAAIFRDVAGTAFAMVNRGAYPLADSVEAAEVEVFGEHLECCAPSGEIHVGSFIDVARSVWTEAKARTESVLSAELRRHLDAALLQDHPRADIGLWHECLAQGVRACRGGASPDLVAEVLIAPFIARAATFWEESQGLTPDDVEQIAAADVLRFRGILRATLAEADAGGRVGPCADAPAGPGAGRAP